MNIFSFWDQKPDPKQPLKQRSADYFLELLRGHQDLWEIASTVGNAFCCPVTTSVIEKCTRIDLEMHVLLPIGSPGEFVSLKGDKVTFSGYVLVALAAPADARHLYMSAFVIYNLPSTYRVDFVINNYKRVRVIDVESLPNKFGVVVYRTSHMLSQGYVHAVESDEVTPAVMVDYISALKAHPGANNAFRKLDKFLNDISEVS